MAGLVTGFVLGMARLIAELNKDALVGSFLHPYADLNFLYFCVVLFAISVITIVVVSLLTPKPKDEQIKGLTYATMTEGKQGRSPRQLEQVGRHQHGRRVCLDSDDLLLFQWVTLWNAGAYSRFVNRCCPDREVRSYGRVANQSSIP